MKNQSLRKRETQIMSLSGERMERELIWAIGVVKKACVFANYSLGFIERDRTEVLSSACEEVAYGIFDDLISIDPLIDGGGSLFNLMINELIARRALELLGKAEESMFRELVEEINLHQSANDVFLTAVKVAVLKLLKEITEEVSSLQGEFQKKEREYAGVLKLGRVAMRDAFPVRVGQEFSSWAEAINRDWWRLNKAFERVRQVNLGGTAVGTGLNCPKEFSAIAIEKLREFTNLPVTKADNLFEATQNVDTLCEVSGFLKTLATNLIKIASDLKFLSSGPIGGIGEIRFDPLNRSFSVILGEVPPYSLDTVIQAGIKVIALDHGITFACSLGSLEFNPYLSFLGCGLIKMLKLLKNTCHFLRKNLLSQIKVDEKKCKEWLEKSGCMIVAFIPYLGHEICAKVYQEAIESGKKIAELLQEKGYLKAEEIEAILNPEQLTSPGFAGIETLKYVLEKPLTGGE